MTEQISSKFSLGQPVKERITGIDGTIIKVTFAVGCEPEYCVTRNGVDCDGRPWPELWFYESRLCDAS